MRCDKSIGEAKSMSEIYQHEVPFWPHENQVDFGDSIPLLYKVEKNYLDKNWPDNGGSQDTVIRQLTSAKKGWVSAFKPENRDKPNIYLLVGKYKIKINVVHSEGRARLWLNRIFFASNHDKQLMLQNAVLASFESVAILTGPAFGSNFERQKSRFNSGQYVEDLLELIKSPWSVDGDEITGNEDDDNSLSYEETEMVDVLRCFIDAEYDLEQLAAQQTAPFHGVDIVARSQRTSYRLHYEVTLDEFDYQRLKESQPSLLVVLSDEQEPTDILLEVTDLVPYEGKTAIHVSIEKQAADINVPSSAMLGIAALPTLKKVRNAVVDSLESQESKNPWLLSLAAQTYLHGQLTQQPVPIPPSKFPPTASQVKAIDSGAGSDDYTLVLGPPGTGKTTVILQWVKYFAKQGKRVLVTSQNNKAVDNVLERLAEEDDFECLRIGNENKISSSLESITLDNKAAELQAKMFSNGNDLIDKLALQKAQLQDLIAARPQIKALLEKKVAIESEQLKSLQLCEQLKQQLNGIVAGLDKQNNDLRQNEETLQKPRETWPVFEGFSIWLNKLKTKSLHKRIEKIQFSIVNLTDKKSDVDAKIAQTNDQLQQYSQAITALNLQVQGFTKGLVALVPEMHIPGSEQSNINIEELEQLNDLLDRSSSLLKSLSSWYEKLKNERQQALYKILIENVNVVGATCIGINTKALFRELDFDVVIVDESGQIQLHNLIVPLSRASKAILVGDHKQLPPIVSDEILEEIKANDFDDHLDLYRLSWFESLWNNAPQDRKIMLDTQFRCPSMISDFVSEAFYEGNYFAGAGMDKKKPLLSFCPQPMIWIDTLRVANKGEKATQQDGRTVVQDNPCETELVINLLSKAIIEKPELAEHREIGVIVPYANHVKAIQKAIKKEQRKGRLTELKMPLNELVASVDSFQGQERDLIIFTFTRSNTKGQVGFLADWRRLNVAQTRAKKQLVMIGDSETLTKGSQKEQGHDVEFKKAMFLLRDQCYKVASLLPASRFLPVTEQQSKPSQQRKSQPKLVGYHD